MIPVMMRMWKPHGADTPWPEGCSPGTISSPHIVFQFKQGSVTDYFNGDDYTFTNETGTHYSEYLNTNFTCGYSYWYNWRTSDSQPSEDTSDEFFINNWWGDNYSTFPFFDIGARYEIQVFVGNGSSDRCDTRIEFQKADGTPVCGLHFYKVSGYAHDLAYGPSLDNLTETASYTAGVASSRMLGGYFEFDDSTLYFTNTRPSAYINTFSYECDMSSVAKIYYETGLNVSAGAGVYAWLINVGTP